MNLLRLLQEGGLGAWGALALGVLASITGVVALGAALGRTRAAFGLGLSTLVLAVLTAGAGIAGTLWGHVQVERAIAFVDPVLRERLTRVGWQEAAGAALVGCFAALVPLALGIFSALGGARAVTPARRQGLEQVASTDERSGRVVMALAFAGLGALGVAGAWVLAHRAPPPGRFDFAYDDDAAWELASAMDRLTPPTDEGCQSLERALAAFFDGSVWPRKALRPVPAALEGWRALAVACVDLELKRDDLPGRLATSPLLHDEAQHARVVQARPPPQVEEAVPPVADASVTREAVRVVVQRARRSIQGCYERVLKTSPTARGKVLVRFTIGAAGRVTSAQDESGEPFPDPSLARCVVDVVKRLEFPPPADGQDVTVSYPFIFAPAE